MIDLIVQRGNGDYVGDDIVDPLITTLPAALERGRNELDEHSGGIPVTLATKYLASVFPGQLVRVEDALQGAIWLGKIISFRHQTILGGAVTTLEILRQSDE